ncbi:glycosyltransferase, putative [Entamoeba histolytica HM-1:IMSS]|uniref:Glycosyltransferase, putative n=4 Tax=Entamoeba histolytica TaxID=5759 RepID=C4MAH3_ENTH1|nr:glycosyltransferase, putative [Entamoeba histolytica HM-1:IMSS]EAL47727.2 glycosyltransferase, putative [Entamoeba histolytica HM-1:IMSS]|eukprot:XP_653113.2 glycosyltransferase, putative [Entamoeba histolytica HM-1:IMSS]
MSFIRTDEITPHHILIEKDNNFVPSFLNKEFDIESVYPNNNSNNSKELDKFNETVEKINVAGENESMCCGNNDKKNDADESLLRQFAQLKPSASKHYKTLTKPPINSTDPINWEIPEICNGRIDVVWLWVNGSDPQWLYQYKQFNNKIKPSFYRDYQTLLYSIRSVYMYAPYIKKYHILTSDQVPSFLQQPNDLKSFKIVSGNYSLEIVSHRQVFDKKNIPTFNSDAIESVIHRIPDLSECFVYLNDDMLLSRNAPPSVWFNKNELRLFTHPKFQCPNRKRMKKIVWDRSLAFTNILLNNVFNEPKATPHPYLSHNCYFLQKSVLQKLENTFERQYNFTRDSKVRNDRSMNVPYAHFLYHLHNQTGKVQPEADWFYFDKLTEKRLNNMMLFKNIDYLEPYCICINDAFTKGKRIVDKEIDFAIKQLEKRYPVPSPFEKVK